MPDSIENQGTDENQGQDGNQNADSLTEEDMREITVMGQKIKKPISEILKLAEKAGGADARFAEYAEMKKSLQDDADYGREVRDLKAKVTNGTATQNEYRRWGQMWDMSDEEVEQMIYGETANNTQSQENKKLSEITMDMLPKELQDKLRRLDELERTDHQRQEEEFITSTRKALDNNEIFQKMTAKVTDPKGKEAIIEKLIASARSEAVRRLQSGTPYGPELIRSVAQSVAEDFMTFSNLVNPTDSAKESGMDAETEAFLGGISGSGALTGIQTQSNEPLKRVDIRDPNWADNVLRRLGGKMKDIALSAKNRP